MFARFFRTPAIILNSREAAEELLEKRSAKYSDRPRFILLNEMYVASFDVPSPSARCSTVPSLTVAAAA